MVPPIADHAAYNESLRASLDDKLFFLPLIPETATSFVDFGCADGSLLKAISEVRPGCSFTGVDCDEAQLGAAHKNFPEASYWPKLLPGRIVSGRPVLVLSSVLHEMVLIEFALDELLRDIGWLTPDYIVIRDMAVDQNARKRRPNLGHLAAVLAAEKHWDLLAEFHKKWDVTESEAALAHFLLKYPYRADWKREMAEDYTAVSIDLLLDGIAQRKGYRLIHFEHYTPQAIRDRIRTDFGFEFTTRTHVKMVLERAR